MGHGHVSRGPFADGQGRFTGYERALRQEGGRTAVPLLASHEESLMTVHPTLEAIRKTVVTISR